MAIISKSTKQKFLFRINLLSIFAKGIFKKFRINFLFEYFNSGSGKTVKFNLKLIGKNDVVSRFNYLRFL